jgi:hypothetical protein
VSANGRCSFSEERRDLAEAVDAGRTASVDGGADEGEERWDRSEVFAWPFWLS